MPAKPCPSQSLWIIDVVACLICAAVTGGVIVGIVNPMLSKRATQSQQREQLTNEEQKCSRLSAAVLSMRKRTNALQHELDTGAVHLEPAGEINHKIARLTSLLGDCNLELEDIQTQPPISQSRCNLVPIHIVGQGRYIQSTRFLKQLHQNLPDIAVTDFDLEGAPAVASDPGQFTFDLCWFAAPDQNNTVQ